MKHKFRDYDVTDLKDNEIFVFGSNLAGRHGLGAAKTARDKFGARYGTGIGLTGQCYAIPTKDFDVRFVLPLAKIKTYVDEFIKYAEEHPENTFQVSAIGCGYAGYTDQMMAPMFSEAPENCTLPWVWADLFKSVKCCECGIGQLHEVQSVGRIGGYKEIQDLLIPKEIFILTCTNCNEEFLNRIMCIEIDAALKPLYEKRKRNDQQYNL